MQELVEFYRTNPVKNLENVSDVYFRFPINKEYAQNGYGFTRPHRSTSLSSMNSNSTASLNRYPSSESGPPLPSRPPRTLSSDSSGTLDLSSVSSQNNALNVDIANRPPLPLPEQAPQPTSEENYVYSKARDVDEDISEKLKDILKSNERCECGIPRSLAELPLGWTVHLSKDPLTAGRLFYQNEQGLTSWTLPHDVKLQLTKVHIANLKKIDKNWKVPH